VASIHPPQRSIFLANQKAACCAPSSESGTANNSFVLFFSEPSS